MAKSSFSSLQISNQVPKPLLQPSIAEMPPLRDELPPVTTLSSEPGPMGHELAMVSGEEVHILHDDGVHEIVNATEDSKRCWTGAVYSKCDADGHIHTDEHACIEATNHNGVEVTL